MFNYNKHIRLFLISILFVYSIILTVNWSLSSAYRVPLLPENTVEAFRMRSNLLADIFPMWIYIKKWEILSLIAWIKQRWTNLELWIGEPNSFWDNNSLRDPQIVTLKGWRQSIKATRDGLVYLRYTQPSSRIQKRTIHIDRVSGGIMSPLYKKWITSDLWWQKILQSSSSPYVQILSNRSLITVSRSSYDTMAKSTDIDLIDTLTTLDAIVESYDDLVGYTGSVWVHAITPLRIHYREDNKSIDKVWINDVYMYATDNFIGLKKENIIDLLWKWRLKKSWWIWHEIGHLYQQSDWTWWEVIESTVNIFSLMAEKKYQWTNRLDQWDDKTNTMRNFISQWKKEKQKDFNQETWIYKWDDIDMIWIRLGMFDELNTLYWKDFYQKLFRSYREYPVNLETDQEKVSLLLNRITQITDKDMTPFFALWWLDKYINYL